MEVITNQIPSPNGTVLAIDLEIFGMRKRKLHRPEGKFACATFSDGMTTWLIDKQDMLQDCLDSSRGRDLWIFHNAQFDLFHLRRWADIPELDSNEFNDTMIYERLMYSGYYDSFSLDDLARRYLNIPLDKTVRKEFEKATELNSRLRQYAALDADITYKVWISQRQALLNLDNPAVHKIWNELEGPMIEKTLKFKGFTVDKDAWESVAAAYEEMRDSIKNKLDFNPGSPQQVKAALAKTGLRVKNTSAPILEPYKDQPLVSKILRFRKAMKLAGTYGRKFISDNVEADGRVHAHYWTLGAATGRMSSANPNMQNIPRAREFRAGFVAAKGHKLIVADYSQQEPRIAAWLSEDDVLTKMFKDGKDIHLEVTRWIFDDATIVKSDPRRYIGKTLNLAITYGLTAKALAGRVTAWNLKNGSSDVMYEYDAQRIIDKYFRLFDELHAWIKHTQYNAGRDTYVETQMGRRLWLNHYNRQWTNNAVNAPIQGGAADQMKLALIMLDKVCKRLGWEYPVVAVIHDEIVAEAPDDIIDKVRDVVVQCMIGAGEEMFPGMVWKVDAQIGSSWAEKA